MPTNPATAAKPTTSTPNLDAAPVAAMTGTVPVALPLGYTPVASAVPLPYTAPVAYTEGAGASHVAIEDVAGVEVAQVVCTTRSTVRVMVYVAEADRARSGVRRIVDRILSQEKCR